MTFPRDRTISILDRLERSPRTAVKTTCQINLTLDPSVGDQIDRIAREEYIRPGAAARTLLIQRLALESAGWKIRDKDWGRLLEAVCRLSQEGVKELRSVLRELGPDHKPDHTD